MDVKFFKKSKSTLIFILIFSAIGVPVFYHLVKVDTKLPIYNPADINPKLVDASVRNRTKNHKVGDFNKSITIYFKLIALNRFARIRTLYSRQTIQNPSRKILPVFRL